MSDLDKFIELYKSVGIALKPQVNDVGEADNVILHLESGDHPKLYGYSGFFSDIIFNADGKFIEQRFEE